VLVGRGDHHRGRLGGDELLPVDLIARGSGEISP
jgi:hypothetical protein